MGSAEKVVILDLRAAPSSLPPLQKVHHLDPGKFSSKRAKNGVLYPFYVYFLKAYHLGKMERSGSVVITCRGPFILFPKAYLGICSRVPNRNYFAVFSKIVKKPRGDHPMLIKMQYSYRPTVMKLTNNFYLVSCPTRFSWSGQVIQLVVATSYAEVVAVLGLRCSCRV